LVETGVDPTRHEHQTIREQRGSMINPCDIHASSAVETAGAGEDWDCRTRCKSNGEQTD